MTDVTDPMDAQTPPETEASAENRASAAASSTTNSTQKENKVASKPDFSSKNSDVQKRLIAKYTGSTTHTRALYKKDTNRELKTALQDDLVWDKDNNWEVDVTDVPEEVLNYLRNSDENFSVSEREVDMSDLED